MKKVLFVKDCRRFEAGSIYKAEKSPACAGVIRIYQSNNELSSLLESDPAFKEVETFEHNGEEWIKHDVGACPVPDDWVVCVMVGGSVSQDVASRYCWDERGVPTIDAYRVISTEEERKDRDERPPSPQELAFAAKYPEPEKPKPLAFPDVKLNDNFSCHVGGKWG